MSVRDADLSAEQYHEALTLVLAALENRPAGDPLDGAEHLGWLQAMIRTIVGASPHGVRPADGLAVLRQGRTSS